MKSAESKCCSPSSTRTPFLPLSPTLFVLFACKKFTLCKLGANIWLVVAVIAAAAAKKREKIASKPSRILRLNSVKANCSSHKKNCNWDLCSSVRRSCKKEQNGQVEQKVERARRLKSLLNEIMAHFLQQFYCPDKTAQARAALAKKSFSLKVFPFFLILLIFGLASFIKLSAKLTSCDSIFNALTEIKSIIAASRLKIKYETLVNISDRFLMAACLD